MDIDEHRQTGDSIRPLLESKLKESIKRFPLLYDHLEILEFVFYKFYQQQARINFQENEEGCCIEPEMKYGRRVYNLHIGIFKRENPITILWSILHEYGHTLQEPQTEEVRLNPVLKYERELDAWNKAESLLPRFNLSNELKSSFTEFSKKRLKRYEEKIARV